MSSIELSTLRGATPQCPSELTLELLRDGALDPKAAAELQPHVRTCGFCTRRLAELAAGFDGLPQVDERKLLAAIRRKVDAPPPSAWRLPAVLGALVMLGLAAVVLTRAAPTLETPGTRVKGGFGLHVFRLEGSSAKELTSGQKFKPKDQLRFTVDLQRAGHVAVLGLESGGALYTAWPSEGTQTFREAGRAIELPGAVELDASVGAEWLFGVLCAQPGESARCTALDTQHIACPASCAVTPFHLDKTP